jgi:hypothetical protein
MPFHHIEVHGADGNKILAALHRIELLRPNRWKTFTKYVVRCVSVFWSVGLRGFVLRGFAGSYQAHAGISQPDSTINIWEGASALPPTFHLKIIEMELRGRVTHVVGNISRQSFRTAWSTK